MRASAITTRLTTADRQRWQQVKAIVAEALEQSAGSAREAFLKKQCGGDAELLHEAESLLSTADTFLEQPADAFEECAENATRTLWSDDPSCHGQRLGAYTLLRVLGRGGMGTVYLAARADGEFEKNVAIKVLKRGMDTDDILRRFKSERQILARFDHPNIARLLDAGTTPDGLPYFVMEYVGGSPVAQFVRDQQLSIPERLELFLKICSAVETAHKHRVVHRDLKSSNIVVASDGEPKLLDFGIAKVLANAEQSLVEVTATGQQHLTPSCASPEQARGESVTPASDIYALGALLFEMLAGCNPHRFQVRHPSREEVTRVVCDEPVPLPSIAALDREMAEQLRGPLDAIVQRAMRKDPGERYRTVSDLAADIRRYGRGEWKSTATSPATAERHQPKTVGKRHLPLLRLAAGAALVAAVVAIAVLSWPQFSSRPSGAVPNESQSADKSIAVLPFQNLSSAPENAFFAAGVQESILTNLAKIADLRVINPASVQHYDSQTRHDLRQVSSQLNVAYVLEGSVQRSGNRVRVTAKLTDARSNEQTWAEHYDRDLSDIFVLQSEIAREIANKLRATVSPSEKAALEVNSPPNLPAYDLYVRAKETERGVARSAEEIEEQVRLLTEAVALDPDFVPALCALARIHLKAYFLKVDPTPERLDLAKKSLAAAARIAPGAGEVHLAEGILLYWGSRDYEAALEKLRQARTSLPNDADVLLFTGLVERRQGRWDEAVQHLSAAAMLDPLSANVLFEIAETYRILRRYDDAVEILDRILVWRPEDLSFQYARAILDVSARADLRRLETVAQAEAATPAGREIRIGLRIELALYQREYDQAEQELANYKGVAPHSPTYLPPREWYQAMIADGRGETAEAQALLEQLRTAAWERTLRHPEDADALMTLAKISAWLGRAEEARSAGEEAAARLSVKTDAAAGPKMLVGLAEIYARLGEAPRALDLLERTAELPGGVTYGALALHTSWDPLRSEPRFEKVLASLSPQ